MVVLDVVFLDVVLDVVFLDVVLDVVFLDVVLDVVFLDVVLDVVVIVVACFIFTVNIAVVVASEMLSAASTFNVYIPTGVPPLTYKVFVAILKLDEPLPLIV